MKVITKLKLKHALLSLLTIAFTLILINSCKKNLTSTTVNDPKLLQAKAWYETNYPKSNKGTAPLKSLSTDNQSETTPFSDLVGPDWERSASYTRLNKNVIEMPFDPTSKYNFGLKAFNKAYCRTSFLILNDGKKYSAYVMLIAADSSYINNDISKLSNNTYQKRDPNFSGSVVYFTPQGKLVGHYLYKNGVLLPPGSNLPQTTNTQQTQSLKTQASTAVYSYTCVDTWEAHYYNGELVSTDLISTECYIDGVTYYGDGGGGGDGGGSTSPPPCPTELNSVKSKIVNAGNQDPIGPPPPPDGGYPDPSQTYNTANPCIVVVPDIPQVSPLDSILAVPNNLTSDQKAQILAVLNQLRQDCLGSAMYNYMTKNQKLFNIKVNSDFSPPATYNPTNGSITIKDPSTLAMISLKEEFFHAYQNFIITGGTSQYANIAGAAGSIQTYVSGGANIEFEAKVMLDMSSLINNGGFQSYSANYGNWLYDLTNGGTSFPTSFTDNQLTEYKTFLADAINYSGSPYNGQIADYTLLPTSMFSLIDNSPCSTH